MEHANALLDRLLHGVDVGKYKTMDTREMNAKETTIAIAATGEYGSDSAVPVTKMLHS